MKIPMTDTPCPRCLALYEAGKIRGETVMPLPESPYAPHAKVPGGKPCCFDCMSADTWISYRGLFSDRRTTSMNFEMARIAVGNDRQEELRLPGICQRTSRNPGRLVRPSEHGDLDRHHAWLEKHCIGRGTKVTSPGWDAVEKAFPTASALWDKFAIENQIEGPIRIALAQSNVRVDYSTTWPTYQTIVVTVMDSYEAVALVLAVYQFVPPERWIKL